MKAGKKLSVPDLEGMSLRNAEILLEIMGFTVPDVRYEESYDAPKTVIKQSPARGTIIDAAIPMELVVSQRSFMDYLPGVYRSSVYDGASFLKNFLWVFRHMYDSLQERIESIPTLFSPYQTPVEFLPWLSRWVGFVIDENWPEDKKRYLLRRAVDYYKIRGTVKGLKLYLSYFVGVEPEIIENKWPFKGFQIEVRSTMDFDSTIFPLVNKAHCFIVNIPLDIADVDDQLIIKIHDIIRSEKPAHTIYYLRFQGETVRMTEFQLVISDDETGAYVIGSGEEIIDHGEVELDYIIEDDEDDD